MSEYPEPDYDDSRHSSEAILRGFMAAAEGETSAEGLDRIVEQLQTRAARLQSQADYFNREAQDCRDLASAVNDKSLRLSGEDMHEAGQQGT